MTSQQFTYYLQVIQAVPIGQANIGLDFDPDKYVINGFSYKVDSWAIRRVRSDIKLLQGSRLNMHRANNRYV